jgi:hypothetical protein
MNCTKIIKDYILIPLSKVLESDYEIESESAGEYMYNVALKNSLEVFAYYLQNNKVVETFNDHTD